MYTGPVVENDAPDEYGYLPIPECEWNLQAPGEREKCQKSQHCFPAGVLEGPKITHETTGSSNEPDYEGPDAGSRLFELLKVPGARETGNCTSSKVNYPLISENSHPKAASDVPTIVPAENEPCTNLGGPSPSESQTNLGYVSPKPKDILELADLGYFPIIPGHSKPRQLTHTDILPKTMQETIDRRDFLPKPKNHVELTGGGFSGSNLQKPRDNPDTPSCQNPQAQSKPTNKDNSGMYNPDVKSRGRSNSRNEKGSRASRLEETQTWLAPVDALARNIAYKQGEAAGRRHMIEVAKKLANDILERQNLSLGSANPRFVGSSPIIERILQQAALDTNPKLGETFNHIPQDYLEYPRTPHGKCSRKHHEDSTGPKRPSHKHRHHYRSDSEKPESQDRHRHRHRRRHGSKSPSKTRGDSHRGHKKDGHKSDKSRHGTKDRSPNRERRRNHNREYDQASPVSEGAGRNSVGRKRPRRTSSSSPVRSMKTARKKEKVPEYNRSTHREGSSHRKTSEKSDKLRCQTKDYSPGRSRHSDRHHSMQRSEFSKDPNGFKTRHFSQSASPTPQVKAPGQEGDPSASNVRQKFQDGYSCPASSSPNFASTNTEPYRQQSLVLSLQAPRISIFRGNASRGYRGGRNVNRGYRGYRARYRGGNDSSNGPIWVSSRAETLATPNPGDWAQALKEWH